jgi:hypothetical protein
VRNLKGQERERARRGREVGRGVGEGEEGGYRVGALPQSDHLVGQVTDMKKQIKTYLLRIIIVANAATATSTQ